MNFAGKLTLEQTDLTHTAMDSLKPLTSRKGNILTTDIPKS
jgi:hypothetical protein